jgi:hypothetical protein
VVILKLDFEKAFDKNWTLGNFANHATQGVRQQMD